MSTLDTYLAFRRSLGPRPSLERITVRARGLDFAVYLTPPVVGALPLLCINGGLLFDHTLLWPALAALAAHPGRVITHGQLLRSVWGPAHEANTEYLRVTVRGLRAKLEADAATPRLILNEPGVGYRLAK